MSDTVAPGPGGLGYRAGYSQLGMYKVTGGRSWIFAFTGEISNPPTGSVNAWIAAGGPYETVVMIQPYEPSYVERFPTRAAVNSGDIVTFPSVEAFALVTAGIAEYA